MPQASGLRVIAYMAIYTNTRINFPPRQVNIFTFLDKLWWMKNEGVPNNYRCDLQSLCHVHTTWIFVTAYTINEGISKRHGHFCSSCISAAMKGAIIGILHRWQKGNMQCCGNTAMCLQFLCEEYLLLYLNIATAMNPRTHYVRRLSHDIILNHV